MVKPDAYKHIGKILSAVESAGLVIGNLRLAKFSSDTFASFTGS